MTCWIEDELHLEEHGGAELIAHQLTATAVNAADWKPRPCNSFCTDGTHVTVGFISHKVADEGHAMRQFYEHHRWADVVKAEPAHEVAPEMYPNRVHRGAGAEPSEEMLTAWLIHFRMKGGDGDGSEVRD